jgi:hypothetical protein
MSMTGYCAFCPDECFEGTAAEVADLAREHRAQAHPELLNWRRKGRRANLAAWRTTLNEQEAEDIEVERTRRMRLLGIKTETAP